MRLAAQERRREGNEPQKTKVAHHAAYPRHEGFEVEIKNEDARAVDASRELQAVVGVGAVPAVSRLQPADVALDVVGGAAGGVPGAEGMEVEVKAGNVSQKDFELIRLAVNDPQTGFECPYCGGKTWVVVGDAPHNLCCLVCGHQTGFAWGALIEKGRLYAKEKGLCSGVGDCEAAEGEK